MGWTNDQATTLDGLQVTYTNTTLSYGAGSELSHGAGSDETYSGGATIELNDSSMTLSGGSSIVVDPTSTLEVDGIASFPGVQNFTGTVNLNHTLTTLTGTTLVGTGGTSIQLDSSSDISVNAHSLPRGLVAYNRAVSDLPAAGTTATTKATAGYVISTSVIVQQGRIYQFVCPALSVRMSVAARAGVFMTFQENAVQLTQTSPQAGEQYVNCPTAGSPVPVPISCLYVRSSPTGYVQVALWIWNVSGGGTVVANGTGGATTTPIEIQIIDWGKDPGITA